MNKHNTASTLRLIALLKKLGVNVSYPWELYFRAFNLNRDYT